MKTICASANFDLLIVFSVSGPGCKTRIFPAYGGPENGKQVTPETSPVSP